MQSSQFLRYLKNDWTTKYFYLKVISVKIFHNRLFAVASTLLKKFAAMI